MTATKKLLAFDLGAESGRGVLGLFDGSRLRLEVVHRFPNGAGPHPRHAALGRAAALRRDAARACACCAAEHGGVDSLGVDTWGVDFALLGRDGTLLGNPRHYRDPHTEGIMEEAFAAVPRAEIFRQTGLQFMRFNTLFQLLALQRDRSPLLDVAETLLFMPDLFHYFFTGIKVNEYTDASTSQMLDPATRTWAYDLVAAVRPARRTSSARSSQPGTVLGPLRAGVAAETGLTPMPVIAPATHDTAAAVAAVPGRPATSWAYISSRHLVADGRRAAGAAASTTRPCSVQLHQRGRRRRHDALPEEHHGPVAGAGVPPRLGARPGTTYGYEELMRLAEAAPPFASLVDPDDAVVHPAAEHARAPWPTSAAAPASRAPDDAGRRRSAAPWRAWPCAIAGCWSGWRS